MSGMGGARMDDTVARVLEFEGAVMDQCRERLGEYERRARKYGLELRPMLVQLKEGLGNRASVYPLREKGRLPGKYASRLTIYAYKDGRPLTRKLEKGQKVVVVEDLISTGGSVLEVVDVLREAGAEVLGVASIFTYGMQKGLDRLAAANVTNHSLSNFDTLCEVAAEEGYIKPEDIARLKKFRQNPSDESWMNG